MSSRKEFFDKTTVEVSDSHMLNNLALLRPDISSQWHDTLNGALMPAMITESYPKKAWWTCDLGHDFETLPRNRKSRESCPVCSGRVILEGFNDVATRYPHLVQAFLPELNSGIDLSTIGKSYPSKLWWRASCGHEVNVRISNCKETIPCAYCKGQKVLIGFNDLVTTNPETAKYWHPTKNLPRTAQSITKGNKTKAWWLCKEGHEALTLTANKIKMGDQCSYCEGRMFMSGENDFQTLYPETAKEWHRALNGDIIPSMVAGGSDKKYWWQCKQCDHTWEAPPSNRGKKGTGCPCCAGHVIKVGHNDLLTLYPKLASEWHPTKNGDLTPQGITAGSPKNIWWKCGKGHEWEAKVRGRAVKGGGCYQCNLVSLKVGSRSIVENYAHLLEEWDYEKNTRLPETYSENSNKPVWWICKQDNSHEWEAVIANRTSKKSGCPICWQVNATSLAEIAIGDFLESLGLDIKRNFTKLLDNGKEIDIWLPEYNVGIEYNGLYWHSEAAGKDRKYHKNKYDQCKEQGVQLIQIWEDDWLQHSEIVMRQLAYRFKKLDIMEARYPEMSPKWFQKHYARKLAMVTIDNKEASKFLDEAHIQGSVRGSYYYALRTSSQEIVAVMVMAKNGKAGELLLSRYATIGIIPGGFTKLLKFAITNTKPKKVISFSDNSTFEGGIYKLGGFTEEATIPEDYMYVKNKKRHHKFGFRLNKFKSDPSLKFIEGLTERELSILNGYTRIWDSGKVRWVLETEI